jgi:hypothetical protein
VLNWCILERHLHRREASVDQRRKGRTRSIPVVLRLPVLIPLAGCGGERAPDDPVVISDSAGVRIVENPAARGWDKDEAWRVVEPALLRIGVIEGAEEDRLYRVSDARRLSDGRIVVANRGTHTLRFFTPDGRFDRAVGGEGEAPGEFRFVEALDVLAGDTLLAVDGQLQRLTFFDAEGGLIRTRSFAREEGPGWGMRPRFEGGFGDGTFLMLALPGHGAPGPGVHRQRAPLRRVDAEGTVRGEPGERDFHDWSVDPVTQARGVVPYGPLLAVTVGDGGFYTGWGEGYELRFHRPDATIERMRERAVPGETAPPFSGLRVDDEGNLWVLRYDPRNLELLRGLPGEGAGAMNWDVFTREGVYLGSLQTPAGLRVTSIGSDWLPGIEKDELGVEYVRLYRIEKPQDPGCMTRSPPPPGRAGGSRTAPRRVETSRGPRGSRTDPRRISGGWPG